jgi:dipeptidyl-peptidase-4
MNELTERWGSGFRAAVKVLPVWNRQLRDSVTQCHLTNPSETRQRDEVRPRCSDHAATLPVANRQHVGCALRAIGVLLLLCASIVSSLSFAADTSFIRDFSETRGFQLGRPVSPQITPDGKSVLFLRAAGPRTAKQSLFEFDVATGQTRELLTAEKLLCGGGEELSPEEKARRERARISVGGFTSFQLTKDGSRILVPLAGKLFLVERASGKSRELPIAGSVLDPRFSPDGKQIAFVRDFDLWVFDFAHNRERRLTRGGSEAVSHGLAEFVAQEEMARFEGYWWSPDSKSLLYQESDAREVEVWHLADPFKPDRAPSPQFYPRPGKANVKVRLGVISAKGGRTRWLNWDSAKHPYLTHADWHERGGLTITVQTRDQREVVLLRANPKTGVTTPLLTESDPVWVNLDQKFPKWLKDGSGFLWSTERNGGWELELRDADGAFRQTLIAKVAHWHSLVHADDTGTTIHFLAQPTPVERQLCRRNPDGSITPLTKDAGVVSAEFGGKPLLYALTREMPGSLARTTVHRADGALAGELPSIAEQPSLATRTELVKVIKGDGFHMRITRPRDFDPAKKYPVLVDIYGGPHAQVVQAAQRGWLLPQWLADQGFIVVAADNRGTPGRGREWERVIFGKFGSLPIEDQVTALRALGAKFPELDLERVGISGWSFGGYMSALAVLRRPDVFKAGVAGAPVTDWLDYDTHYTERYLGVPGTNDTVYAANSLLADAPKLSRPLLLIHGTADDNVFFRHSLKLADALTRAGRPFEFVPFGGFTHMVPEPAMAEQRWVRTVEFLQRHLGNPR